MTTRPTDNQTAEPILTGKRNIGYGCIGGMGALQKYLIADGYDPIMVQTRSQMEYGYGKDEWCIYIGA